MGAGCLQGEPYTVVCNHEPVRQGFADDRKPRFIRVDIVPIVDRSRQAAEIMGGTTREVYSLRSMQNGLAGGVEIVDPDPA